MTDSPLPSLFHPRVSIEQVEEGHELAPKFDAQGLIPVITQDSASGDILMLGYMNKQAMQQTIITGEAHYFSRSRQCVWHKGSTSGLIQRVDQILIDDDQDAVWLKVTVAGNGASCHVGYRSCFYRAIPTQTRAGEALEFVEQEKIFDPLDVYGDAPNPTIV